MKTSLLLFVDVKRCSEMFASNLNVHQRTCVLCLTENLFIPHPVQIGLRDCDALVAQQSGQRIEVKSRPQLELCVGMTEGVGRYTDVRGHITALARILYNPVNHRICEGLAVLTQEDVVGDHAIGEVGFADSQILNQPLTQERGFRHDPLLVSFPVDDDVVELDLLFCQSRQFAQPNPRINQHHHNDLVADGEVVVPLIEVAHLLQLPLRKGADDDLGLFGILDLLRQVLFGIPFFKGVFEKYLVGFQQVVDIVCRATQLAHLHKELLDVL